MGIFGDKRKVELKESYRLCALAGWELMHGDKNNKSVSLYEQAIIACPENIIPYWALVWILHTRQQDDKALSYLDKATTLDGAIMREFANDPEAGYANLGLATVDTQVVGAAVVGVFLQNGREDAARNYFSGEVQKYWVGRTDKIKQESYKEAIRGEMVALPFAKGCLLLEFISLAIRDGFLTSIEGREWRDSCIEMLALKAKFFYQENKFNEALECLDFALRTDIVYFRFINRESLKELERTVSVDKREWSQWDSINSKDDLLIFLHRRLALRLHPDFSNNTQERGTREQVMAEINKAREDKNLDKLVAITRTHAPALVPFLEKKIKSV